MKNKVCIYGLIDPRDNKIKYIGQTIDLERRYKQHCSVYGNSSKDQWVLELINSGFKPALVHLETVQSIDANPREQWWIELLKVIGGDMVNTAKPASIEYDYSWLFQDMISSSWEYGKSITSLIISILVFIIVLGSALNLNIQNASSIAEIVLVKICQFVLPISSSFVTFVLIEGTPFNVIIPSDNNSSVKDFYRWCMAMWRGKGSLFMGIAVFLIFHTALAIISMTY